MAFDPQSLDRDSRCFVCIPEGFKPAVNVSLLNAISGFNLSPQQLITLSDPFQSLQGLPSLASEVFLLAQLANLGSFTASQLADAAKCFNCGRDGDLEDMLTYLYAVNAGGSLVPGDLMAAALRYQVLFGIEWRVTIYLLAQIAGVSLSTLGSSLACNLSCLDTYTLRSIRVYLLSLLTASGGMGNLIPGGSTYSGAGTFTISVLANSIYCITWGANDLSMTIGGVTYMSTGAGTGFCFTTGSNTTLTLTGVGSSIITLKLQLKGSQNSAPNAPTGFTWALSGANVVANWNAAPVGVTKTELWTSSDNISFSLAATIAVPTTTASVAAPAPGNTIYAQIRFCTATICGVFTAVQSVFVSTLLTGIVSYWNLNEAANITRVDSAGTNNLADTLADVGSVAGILGNAANYPGGVPGRELKRAANASLLIGAAESLSISAWFNIQSLGNNRGIVTVWTGASTVYFLWMNATDGSIEWLVRDGGSVQRTIAVWPIGLQIAGTWHHVVCGFDRPNNQIFKYFDGGVRTNAACVGALTGSGDFAVGNYASLEAWIGQIDEVGLWKKVLSAPEVAELFNAGAGKTYPFT